MNKRIMAIIANLLLVIFACINFYLFSQRGVIPFYSYTENSNLLAGIAALLLLIFLLIKKEISEVPTWIMILKYISVCCLALTLAVVVCILIPQNLMSDNALPWYYMLTNGPMLFSHTLNPLIAIISFIFFENDKRFNKKKILIYPLIATLLYGIVMVIINYMKLFVGPYFFLMVDIQPIYMTIIWFAVILLINYVLARILLIQNQKRVPRRRDRFKQNK